MEGGENQSDVSAAELCLCFPHMRKEGFLRLCINETWVCRVHMISGDASFTNHERKRYHPSMAMPSDQ